MYLYVSQINHCCIVLYCKEVFVNSHIHLKYIGGVHRLITNCNSPCLQAQAQLCNIYVVNSLSPTLDGNLL